LESLIKKLEYELSTGKKSDVGKFEENICIKKSFFTSKLILPSSPSSMLSKAAYNSKYLLKKRNYLTKKRPCFQMEKNNEL